MTNIITLEKLQSYLGQLLDLQTGNIEEIVIKKENAAELIEIIKEAIKQREEFDELDNAQSKAEAEAEFEEKAGQLAIDQREEELAAYAESEEAKAEQLEAKNTKI